MRKEGRPGSETSKEEKRRQREAARCESVCACSRGLLAQPGSVCWQRDRVVL